MKISGSVFYYDITYLKVINEKLPEYKIQIMIVHLTQPHFKFHHILALFLLEYIVAVSNVCTVHCFHEYGKSYYGKLHVIIQEH